MLSDTNQRPPGEFDEAEFGFTPSGLLEIFDQLPVALAVTRGADHVFVYANDLYRHIHEPLHGPLLGRTVGEVFKGTLDDDYMRIRRSVFVDQVVHRTSAVPIPLADRNTYWDITLIPVGPAKGLVNGILSVAVDATERHNAERVLHDAVQEKDLLLREAHHRVKNSLQIVSAMLTMQERVTGGAGPSALRDAAARIRTIATLHERLHRAKSTDRIELSAYLAALCEDLDKTAGRSDVRIAFSGEVRWLANEHAISVALIVNELVTNALKYAYPMGAGTVRVVLVHAGGRRVSLTVADDGVGLPADEPDKPSNTLGLTMARSLARSVGGELAAVRKHPGAAFELVFPLPE